MEGERKEERGRGGERRVKRRKKEGRGRVVGKEVEREKGWNGV